MIATLDVLSGGRVIAGLGAANSEREHKAYGRPFPAAPDRLALLEDALQALPMLWGPGSPSFEGMVISIPKPWVARAQFRSRCRSSSVVQARR